MISDVRTTVAFSRIFSALLNILVLPEKNLGNLLVDFRNEANKYKRQFRNRVLSVDSGTLSTGRNYEWRSRTTSKTMDLFLRKIT